MCGTQAIIDEEQTPVFQWIILVVMANIYFTGGGQWVHWFTYSVYQWLYRAFFCCDCSKKNIKLKKMAL